MKENIHKDNLIEPAVSLSEWLICGLISCVVGIGIAFIIVRIFCPVWVAGHSMMPTYNNGDLLRGTRDFIREDIGRGDIVVFTHNGEKLIKRVCALPGDTAQIAGGFLIVNSKIDSDLQFDTIEDEGLLKEEITLGDDEYLCLGDNRNHSDDCRMFGPITFDDIDVLIIGNLFEEKIESEETE